MLYIGCSKRGTTTMAHCEREEEEVCVWGWTHYKIGGNTMGGTGACRGRMDALLSVTPGAGAAVVALWQWGLGPVSGPEGSCCITSGTVGPDSCTIMGTTPHLKYKLKITFHIAAGPDSLKTSLIPYHHHHLFITLFLFHTITSLHLSALTGKACAPQIAFGEAAFGSCYSDWLGGWCNWFHNVTEPSELIR